MLVVTPFAVAIPLGVRRRDDTALDVRVHLDATRCLEGDTIEGRIDLTAPPGMALEVAIECRTAALAAPADDPWAWHVAADVPTPVGLPFTVETSRWGRYPLGQLLVRVIDHGSLLDRRASGIELPDVSVLPIASHLDQLLAPSATHAALGAHPSRRHTGEGYDFAEIRAYQPGDRLRDLNWRATLRRGEPHVNRRHPERAGDVLIVLDAFPDSLRGQTEVGEELIMRSGRVTWAIARGHLEANDRVGLVAEGANPVWLPPGAGRRARYALLQALLDAFSTSAAVQREIRPIRRFQVPPSALVIAISPLGRERTLRMMVGLRAAGRAVAVMAIDTTAWLAEVAPGLPDDAHRLAALTFEERVATLRRQGVPVVEWRPGDDLGRAVRLLGRIRHGSRRSA
jgi:uncharacterized protein (DUF58 family)